MPTFVAIGNFTDQGIRNVKDTTKRVEAFRAMAQKAGVTVKDFFWTMGQYDFVATMEAPDEHTAAALGLSVNSLGNARTCTMRAFSASEMNQGGNERTSKLREVQLPQQTWMLLKSISV